MLFNCGKLEDEQIRKALSLAIDRDALTELVDVTAQAATGLVPPGVPEGEADFRTTGGDLLDNDGGTYEIRCQEAVELMQEAGYDRGSDLSAELGTLEYLYVDEGQCRRGIGPVRHVEPVPGTECDPQGRGKNGADDGPPQRQLHPGRSGAGRRVQ